MGALPLRDLRKFDVHISRQVTEGYIIEIEAASIEVAKEMAAKQLLAFIINSQREGFTEKPVSIATQCDAILTDYSTYINIGCDHINEEDASEYILENVIKP